MDTDWHHRWANYLVRNRDIRNWKDYARESAEIEVGRAWSILEFYKDPSELMVSDSAIEEKAEEEAGWFFLHGDLRVYGIEIWNEYPGEAKVSRQERSIWKKTYIETYRDLVDERIDRLIPKEIRDRLDIFCRLVTGMRHAIDYAQAPSRRPFGLRLGADDSPKKSRRAQPPEEPKIRPSRKEIISTATRGAEKQLEKDWHGVLRGDGQISFALREIERGLFSPAGWEMTDAEVDLFKEAQAKAYREALEENLSDFAPPEAWAHASLICLVYHQMAEQGLVDVKKGEIGGFQLYREREESWLREAREGWEKETIEGREEWAKELREKEARLREAEQKAKKRAKK